MQVSLGCAVTWAVPQTHLSVMLPVAANTSSTAWALACFQPPWGRRQSVPPLAHPPANGPAP